MVSISDIRQWKADTLEDARNQYKKALDTLTSEGDDFAGLKITGADWDGEAASRAMAAHDKLVREGDRHAAGLGAIVKGLEQAADAVEPLPRQINEAEELGRKYGFTVGDSGEITDQFAGKKPPPDMHPADRARAKQEITTKLQEVVRTATDIDTDLANVFNKAGSGGYGVGQTGSLSTAAAAGKQAMALTTPDPPKHGTPAQNAAWWATLSKAEKDAAMNDPVNKIGNLDGIPAWRRSTANMQHLPQLEQRLQQQIKAERAAGKSVDELQKKLSSLQSIGKVVRQSAQLPDSQKYFLLGVGMDGNGRAIVAKGNPDTADNVATYVPGTGSNLGGFGQEQTKAERMYQAAGRADPNAKNSVITWIGYDAPQDLPHAASGSYAEDGKAAFDHFQQGLRESHPGTPSHNVAVGHSYGTTLIGHGASSGNAASDDLVFVGSPGVGVDHANQLHVGADHVYATEAKNDAIRLSNMPISTAPGAPGVDPILGPDPTSSDFGGKTFAAHPGTPGSMGGVSIAAHSEYWDPGNSSLVNMGKIIDGQAPNAH